MCQPTSNNIVYGVERASQNSANYNLLIFKRGTCQATYEEITRTEENQQLGWMHSALNIWTGRRMECENIIRARILSWALSVACHSSHQYFAGSALALRSVLFHQLWTFPLRCYICTEQQCVSASLFLSVRLYEILCVMTGGKKILPERCAVRQR